MANTDITISYPVFYPVKKFYWSPDAIMFALMGMALLPMILPLSEQLSFAFRLLSASLIGIYFIYRFLTRYFTHETLRGYLHGELQMKPSEIIFEGQTIPISNLRKLNFNFINYEGQPTGSGTFYSLDGQLSNGVKNSVTIYFIEGGERTVFFQRKEPNDILLLKPLLIEYCKKDLIGFNDLIVTLGLSYKQVQELKAEYF